MCSWQYMQQGMQDLHMAVHAAGRAGVRLAVHAVGCAGVQSAVMQ